MTLSNTGPSLGTHADAENADTNPMMLAADVAWRPFGLHPALLGSLMIVAGVVLAIHAARCGAIRGDKSMYLSLHPQMYWGVALIAAGFGGLFISM